MARYAVRRTSTGFGTRVEEGPGVPPLQGAVADGSFAPFGDDELYVRWVAEFADAAALTEAVRAAGGKAVLLARGTWEFEEWYGAAGDLDGLLEIYDAYRE